MTDNPAAIPAALIGLTVIGGVIRWIVAGQDFFADELATYWIASTNNLSGVVDTVSSTAEITPPLGFMLAWLAAQVDLSPEAIRMPALIAGTGTIPLVYAIGVRTVGRGAGLLAACLVTVSPFLIYYSAEARGYAVMVAFVLLSTLALLNAVDSARVRWWVAYGVFVAAAAYTHYTSIFALSAQFLWVLWMYPPARKPLLIATSLAAIAYVPWLPSLKGDIDSPTTDILSMLTPFDAASIKQFTGHWLVGFPYANVAGIKVAGLRDLPGIAGLVMIAAGIAIGLAGLWVRRRELRTVFAGNRRRIGLVALVALATPLGEALASLLGTNIYGTRNLAASWPYVALTGAALLTAGTRWMRIAVAILLVGGLSLGAAKMLTTSYERPNYTDVAEYVDADVGGVVVDAAALTPGPLANFDVESSKPDAPVFRLNIPAEKQTPFDVYDRKPDPAVLARQVAAAADEAPITIVSTVDSTPAVTGHTESQLAMQFIAALPPDYELTQRRVFPGLLDLQALTFEKAPSS